MTELRHHDRVYLDRAIAIRLSNGQLVQARLVNLSEGGLSVLYPAPAEIGASLGLHFRLLDKNDEPVTIHCQGIVRHTHVHRDGFLSGFEFNQISDHDRASILHFIQRKRANSNQYLVVR